VLGGKSWLGGRQAGWQLAGWLVGWVLLAGWLAGHGHTRIQRPAPRVIKFHSRGAATNQMATGLEQGSLQATRMQDCRTTWTSRLQCYKITGGVRLLVAKITAWWPQRGRRIYMDIHTHTHTHAYLYIYIYIYIYKYMCVCVSVSVCGCVCECLRMVLSLTGRACDSGTTCLGQSGVSQSQWPSLDPAAGWLPGWHVGH
jgi:hypothetical protein